MSSLNIGVIGPAGFGGSYLCVELLRRGHNVRGLSRSPEKLGQHQHYSCQKIDISEAAIEDLVEAFKGLDIMINEYGPHTAGEGALQYSKLNPIQTPTKEKDD